MTNFSKILAGFFLATTFSLSTSAATLNCTVWETMWSSQSGKPEVVQHLQLVGDEDAVNEGLKNNLTLTVERYADAVSMYIHRPANQREKEIWTKNLPVDTIPLDTVRIASASGSLKVGHNSTLEMGAYNYYVLCKY